MKMTDSQMKKFFNALLRDERDYDDLSIALSLLTALGKFDEYLDLEPKNYEKVVSER